MGFQLRLVPPVPVSFAENGSAFGERDLDKESNDVRYRVGGAGSGGIYVQVGVSADEGWKYEGWLLHVPHSLPYDGIRGGWTTDIVRAEVETDLKFHVVGKAKPWEMILDTLEKFLGRRLDL